EKRHRLGLLGAGRQIDRSAGAPQKPAFVLRIGQSHVRYCIVETTTPPPSATDCRRCSCRRYYEPLRCKDEQDTPPRDLLVTVRAYTSSPQLVYPPPLLLVPLRATRTAGITRTTAQIDQSPRVAYRCSRGEVPHSSRKTSQYSTKEKTVDGAVPKEELHLHCGYIHLHHTHTHPHLLTVATQDW
ncbi:hypothetical protein CH063_04847, partial [Colletotrichum higginsianum]